MKINVNEHHEPTDADLLNTFRRGKAEAFNALVERYYGPVYAIALARLQSVEVAEDLAQEIFLRAFVQQHSLRDANRFAPWVCNMARNLAIDWHRRGETRSRLLPMIPLEESHMPLTPDSPTPGADDLLLRKQELELTEAALATLQPVERELVLLHFTEGLSKSEIARTLGVHPSTVGRNLEAAVGKLRRHVQGSVTVAVKQSPSTKPTTTKTLRAARTVALISAFAALAPEAKAAVAAKLAAESVATSGSQSMVGATVLEFLKGTILYNTGGATIMSTGKLISTGIIAASLAGVAYVATSNPSTAPTVTAQSSASTTNEAPANADPIVRLKSFPVEIVQYQEGQDLNLKMEFGKSYDLQFPYIKVGMKNILITITKEGELINESKDETGKVYTGYGKFKINEMVTFPVNSMYIQDQGSLSLTYSETSGELKFWHVQTNRPTAKIKELTTQYLEGKLSTPQYRQGYVGELKRLNLGPQDSEFRSNYYKELLNTLPTPNQMLQDLPNAQTLD